MALQRPLSKSIAVLALCTTATVGAVGAASADHTEYMLVPGHTYSLGAGNDIFCAGQITTNIRTPHDRPATALVTMTWSPVLSSGSGRAPTCPVTALVNWHNLDTGAAGTVPEPIATTPRSPAPAEQSGGYLEIPTGPGRVTFTIATTSMHHIGAAPLEVLVP